ncbi:MAG: HDOD domain-containing protein [bacterium]
MKHNDIQSILSKVDKLPELYHIAIKVSKMLDNFNVSINEVSKVISLDQALTTQILKLCNSANYGFSRKIVSINDAIAKLGFTTLKNMIFIVISHGILNQEVKGYDLGKGELWKNSVSCAFYARHLASLIKYSDPEIAFTAGLLRDIGKLIIHEYVKDSYDEIIEMINSKNIPFYQAEEKVLGFNHCQIGSEIANKWNFPNILIETIEYHHNPDIAFNSKCEDSKLIAIIHVADCITMMLGTGMGCDGMMYNFELNALKKLNISQQASDIEKLISEMIELNSEIDSMVGYIDGK